MDIKILILLAALAHFILGVLIIRKNYRNTVHVCFALFSWVFTGWSISIYFYEHPYLFSSLIWIKIVYLFVVLMITTILYFSFYFPVEKKRYLRFAISLNVIVSFVLFYILFFTNLWVVKVVPYHWGYETELGFGFKFFQVVISVFSVWIFFNLIRGYKLSKGIKKMQAKYMLSGMIILTFFMVPTNVLLPLVTGDSRYFWLSPILSLSFVGTTAYAIVRYRLMDIGLIVKKSLTYFLTVVFLMVVMVLGFMRINKLMAQEELLDWKKMTVGIVIFTFGLLLFNKLSIVFQSFIDKHLFKTVYSYQEALEKLTQQAAQIIKLDELIAAIVDTVMKSMGLKKAAMLLAHETLKEGPVSYHVAKVVGFSEESQMDLIKGGALARYLKQTGKPLVLEELEMKIRDCESQAECVNLALLKTSMEKSEASVCLPMLMKNRLKGIIVLGNKISSDAFTYEDMKLLESLAVQAAVAIENAELYQTTRDFNKELKKRVDEATKELQEKNKNLKDLLEMKSEFLAIASHQLRTPTSIVRGMLSILSEDGDQLSKQEQKEFIEQAYSSINHLERIVHDLLSATELEGGKIKFSPEPTDIKNIVEIVVKERKLMADKKNIELILNESPKDLPLALADKHKIEEVIDNLIDNAINYTIEGKVEVSIDSDKNYLWVKVQDTGIGLTEKDYEVLFKRFERGEKVTQIMPNGSGLGLYIGKGIVESLNGRITVESPGKGKGSTFIIYLPRVQ